MYSLMFKIFLFLLLFVSTLFSSSKIVEQALALKLYEKNEWKALLHYEDGYYTQDKNFIISVGQTPQEELSQTITGFFEEQSELEVPDNHLQCKFPARKLFLEKELGSSNIFPEVSCSQLEEYKTRAPVESISLIYVSENVKHPTSMMGHSFFKLDGKINNTNVSHAASFYTIIDTVNLFKIAYQNFYSGMKGQFSLRPYRETLLEYMNENRNVWEYKLKLSNYRRQLIYYHIWELKDVKLKYYFTSYNCSTVVYFSLVLAKPELYQDYTFWLTPLQTAKLLYENNLIAQTELKPSNDWLLRMSYQELDSHQTNNIVEILKKKQYSKIKTLTYLELQFLIAYANNQYEENNLNTEDFKELYIQLNNQVEELEKVLDITAYKSPAKIPNERQFKLGYASYNNKSFAQIGFLPASHFLNDDNREYFTESDLRIFELSIIANKDSVYLDEFNIYSMKSYIPFEKYTQNFSYEFEMKIDREPNRLMEYQYNAKIGAGFGLDLQIFNDIHVFGILNGGVGYDQLDQVYFNAEPYIGFMIYEIGNMKTLFQYSQKFINTDQIYESFNIDHNLFISKKWKCNLFYKHYNPVNRALPKNNELKFSFNYMF